MRRYDDLMMLDPQYRKQFIRLADDLAAKGSPLKPFETFRTDAAQLQAFQRGNSRASDGSQSAHGWGLAVDFVGYNMGQWFWPDHDDPVWAQLHDLAERHRLDHGIRWDKPHVQVPEWRKVRSMLWRTRLCQAFPR